MKPAGTPRAVSGQHSREAQDSGQPGDRELLERHRASIVGVSDVDTHQSARTWSGAPGFAPSALTAGAGHPACRAKPSHLPSDADHPLRQEASRPAWLRYIVNSARGSNGLARGALRPSVTAGAAGEAGTGTVNVRVAVSATRSRYGQRDSDTGDAKAGERRVRIGLLGTLAVHDDAGRPVRIGGQRVRALLILLALDVGRVVPAYSLIDRLWGDADAGRPVDAANALQSLISRLRAALREGGVDPGVIESSPTAWTRSPSSAMPARARGCSPPGTPRRQPGHCARHSAPGAARPWLTWRRRTSPPPLPRGWKKRGQPRHWTASRRTSPSATAPARRVNCGPSPLPIR